MMKKNIYNGILILILSGFFCSCDPAIGYEFYLNNKSDKEITIYYKGLGFNDTTMNMKVYPKTEVLLYETSIWGKNPHDEKEEFLDIFDTLSITVTDSSKLLKDYLKRDNWIYSNDINHFGLIKTGTNIYKIEILNQDIQ